MTPIVAFFTYLFEALIAPDVLSTGLSRESLAMLDTRSEDSVPRSFQALVGAKSTS